LVHAVIDREKYLARQRRYNASEKGRARHRTYNVTGRRRDANRRYRESHHVPRIGGEGLYLGVYRLPDHLSKTDFQSQLADFRAKQAAEYREESESLADVKIEEPAGEA
jgi:hypothetical protein